VVAPERREHRQDEQTLNQSLEPCTKATAELQAWHDSKDTNLKIISYAQLFSKLQNKATQGACIEKL